jgi:hypothetical protein
MSEPTTTRAYFLWQFGCSYFKKRFYFDKKVVCSGSTHVECLSEWSWIGYLDNLQLSRTFSFTFPWGKGLSDFSTLAFLLHNVRLPANIWFCFFSSQVEHFLGRKPETGFSGAPKKPKI